jgi:hypothetical protein
MDVVDVASLDGAVQAWDRWMGRILCLRPDPDPAGIEEKVNLLEKGKRFIFTNERMEKRWAIRGRQQRGFACQQTLVLVYVLTVLSVGVRCLRKLHSGHGTVVQ